MNLHPHRRTWLLIAAIAIAVALVLLMVPHTHGNDSGAWLAILPLLCVGALSPLSLLSPLAFIYIGLAPAAPVLPASFQRPPPFRLA
jgi:ABC-type transport system involved in cytochrome bd biosynthesis fused ATPase/permease subunit